MSRFGQIMALFDTINQAQAHTADYLIARRQQKGEMRIAEKQLQHEQNLSRMDLAFREKQLQSQMQVSQRRDDLFKDIALYAGIGIGTIAILITLGVLFVGAKREEKYEYVEEVIS